MNWSNSVQLLINMLLSNLIKLHMHTDKCKMSLPVIINGGINAIKLIFEKSDYARVIVVVYWSLRFKLVEAPM